MVEPAPTEAMARLVWITHQLRQYCPWTAQLSHADLTEYLVEEAHEAVEAIEDGDREEIIEELGDVLFQVVLNCEVDEDFSLDDVAEVLSAKMIRRNPHVFTPGGELVSETVLGTATIDDVEKNWERIKQTEKSTDTATFTAVESIFHVPSGLSALAAASKIWDRATRQESNPLTDVPTTQSPSDEEELGAQLFGLISGARQAGLNPERALRAQLQRYRDQLGETY